MKCVPCQSPSTRKPIREFCGENRYSEFLPFTVLLYGTLPKFVPMLEPAFLSRQMAVRSIKPIGIIQVLPSRINAGLWPSGTASQGLLAGAEGFAAAACGAGEGEAMGAGSGAAGGSTGTALATCPRLGSGVAGAAEAAASFCSSA